MDMMIHAVINGKPRPLHYSIEVMFAVNDKFGSLQKAFEELERDDREGFEAVRFLGAAMANDAELCRRAEGADPHPMIKEEEISLRMRPLEYAALKQAICDAITAGYKQEQSDEKEEVDLGLIELQKKEKAGT